MNHSFNGNHSYKSHVFLTVNDFVQKNVRSWKFLGSSKQSAVSGELALSSFQKEINYSFIDYLRGGIDINLITCIDFTGSNGIPSHPGSLHYMAPSIDAQPNQYQKAIQSVGQILLEYDNDKLVPTYGFGGKLLVPIQGGGKILVLFLYTFYSKIMLGDPSLGQTSNFFPLTFDYSNPYATGLNNLFDLYRNALSMTELSGPTYFAPLLKNIKQFQQVKSSQNNNSYTVLLILTDGCIHDMDLTKREIVEMSKMGISIIIVGIGNEDFKNMEELDSDGSVNFFLVFFFIILRD